MFSFSSSSLLPFSSPSSCRLVARLFLVAVVVVVVVDLEEEEDKDANEGDGSCCGLVLSSSSISSGSVFFFGFFFFSEDLEVRLRLLVSRALLAFVILGSVDVVFVAVVSGFDSSDADEDRRRRLLLRDEERFGVVVVNLSSSSLPCFLDFFLELEEGVISVFNSLTLFYRQMVVQENMDKKEVSILDRNVFCFENDALIPRRKRWLSREILATHNLSIVLSSSGFKCGLLSNVIYYFILYTVLEL